MLTVRIGQLTVGDFHPIRPTALSAAPIEHSVNTQPFFLGSFSEEKKVRSILLALLTLCHSFKTYPQVFPRNGLAINKNYRERSLMLRK